MSKWPDWEEARDREESEWTAEVPEIIIVSDAVEGTFVDLYGECCREQVEAKLSRRGREILNEGEEIISPKRNVILVESEETQDCVREAKSTEFEEEEERTFVPSAVSVPLKPLFRCDISAAKRPSATGSWLLCWSMKVMKHTRPTCVRSVSTNTCMQKEKKPLSNVQWRQVVEKKAYRGRMWKMMGREPHLRGMWEYSLQERSRVKRFPELADEEKQAGIQGQWQQESPAREYLEQVKCCNDTDCTHRLMKHSFFALISGEWEE